MKFVQKCLPKIKIFLFGCFLTVIEVHHYQYCLF